MDRRSMVEPRAERQAAIGPGCRPSGAQLTQASGEGLS